LLEIFVDNKASSSREAANLGYACG